MYPDYRILRPLTKGERIIVPRGRTPSLGSGALRARHAQAGMLIQAAGVKWWARCIQWSYGPGAIYEVTVVAYLIGRHC